MMMGQPVPSDWPFSLSRLSRHVLGRPVQTSSKCRKKSADPHFTRRSADFVRKFRPQFTGSTIRMSASPHFTGGRRKHDVGILFTWALNVQ